MAESRQPTGAEHEAGRPSEPDAQSGSNPAESSAGKAKQGTINGNLANISLTDIFQTLSMSQMIGVLQVKTASWTRDYFINGKDVQLVDSSQSSYRRLGEKLIAAGMLTQDGLGKAILAQRRKGGNLSAMLVEQGLLTETDIQGVIRVFEEEELLSLFNLDRGSFEFFKGDKPSGEALGTNSFDINHVLLEVARRADEWELIMADLGSLDEVLVPVADAAVPEMEDQEERLYQLATGSTSVREMADQSLQPLFECAKTMVSFLRQGLLRKASLDELTELTNRLVKVDAIKSAANIMALVRQQRSIESVTQARQVAAGFQKVQDSKTAATVLVEAAAREQEREPKEALHLIKEAMLLDQYNSEARRLYRDRLDPEEDQERILELTTELCDIHFDQGRTAEALAEAERLEAIDPGSQPTLIRIARIHQKLDNIRQAEKALDSLADLLRQEGETRQLIPVLNQLIKLVPYRKEVAKELESLKNTGRIRTKRTGLRYGVIAAVVLILAGAGLVVNNHLGKADNKAEFDRLLAQGDQAGALRLAQAIIKDHPGTELAGRASRLVKKDAEGRSIALHKKLVAADREVRQGLEKGERLQAQGQLAAALDLYRQLLGKIRVNDQNYTRGTANTQVKSLLKTQLRYEKHDYNKIIQELRVPAIIKLLQDQKEELARILVDAKGDAVTFTNWRTALEQLRRMTGPELAGEYTALVRFLEEYDKPDGKWPFTPSREDLTAPLNKLAEMQTDAKRTLTELEKRAEDEAINKRLGPLWLEGEEAERAHDFRRALQCFDRVAKEVRESESRRVALEKCARFRTIIVGLDRLAGFTGKGDHPSACQVLKDLQAAEPTIPFARLVQLPFSITTTPPGAEVEMDGKTLGRSPLTIQYSPAGKYTVKCELAGYRPYRHTLTGSGSGNLDLVLTRKLAWTGALGGAVDTEALLTDRALVVSDRNGCVTSLDPTTGKVKWTWRSGDLSGKLSGPAGVDGRLYVGSADRSLRCLALDDGRVVWTARLKSPPLGRPVVTTTGVLVATESGRLLAFDPQGSRLWDLDMGGRVTTPPVSAGGLLLVGLRPRSLQARSLATGQLTWQVALPDLTTAAPLVTGKSVVVTCMDGSVVCLDLTGRTRWTRKLRFPIRLPALALAGGLLILPAAKQARLLALEDGRELETRELPAFPSAPAALVEEQVFLGLDNGELLAVRAGDLATIWHYQEPGNRRLAAPVVGNQSILVLPTGSRTVRAFPSRVIPEKNP